MVVLYRHLRPDEDPENGLRAKNPKAQTGIEDHVLNGSSSYARSQYISCCETLAAAQLFASKSYNEERIVRIVIDKDTPGILNIIFLSDLPMIWEDRGRNFANKFQEVLVQGYIPPECITLLSN